MFGFFRKKENFVKIGVKNNNVDIQFNLKDEDKKEELVALLIALIGGDININIMKAASDYAQQNPEWASQIQYVISYFQNDKNKDFILPLEVFDV